jgi:hypothetical protein
MDLILAFQLEFKNFILIKSFWMKVASSLLISIIVALILFFIVVKLKQYFFSVRKMKPLINDETQLQTLIHNIESHQKNSSDDRKDVLIC